MNGGNYKSNAKQYQMSQTSAEGDDDAGLEEEVEFLDAQACDSTEVLARIERLAAEFASAVSQGLDFPISLVSVRVPGNVEYVTPTEILSKEYRPCRSTCKGSTTVFSRLLSIPVISQPPIGN